VTFSEVMKSTAEKARERKIREDPMAEVLNSLFVSCKRCGGCIKLSVKSLYDPFHWKKHRERCLKKPVHIVTQKKREVERLRSRPPKRTSDPSGKAGLGPLTPPLTTDDDDEVGGHDQVKGECPSPGESVSPPHNAVGAL